MTRTFQQGGGTLNFAEFGAGTRPVGMGGVLVAVAEDAESTDWDSANMATLAGPEPNPDTPWTGPVFFRSKISDLRSKIICFPRSWPHRYRHETPIQACSSMRPRRLRLQLTNTRHENRNSKIENRGHTSKGKEATNCQTTDFTEYHLNQM